MAAPAGYLPPWKSFKDKKWEDYQKQVQKGEELLIEELVTCSPGPDGGLTALEPHLERR